MINRIIIKISKTYENDGDSSILYNFINYIIKMDHIEIGIILIIMLFLFIGIPVICICYNFMKKKENILYKEETNKILSY